jgi:hypothetical protein
MLDFGVQPFVSLEPEDAVVPRILPWSVLVARSVLLGLVYFQISLVRCPILSSLVPKRL